MKGVIACAIALVVVVAPFSGGGGKKGVFQQTSIMGRISPESSAEFVRIIGGKDSLKTLVISGNFFARVRPGTYKLFISTKTRNKDVYLDNLVVKQNQALDIGEIILQ